MFEDREQAGARLADRLAEERPRDPVVLALPRGGVPVAEAVARRLNAPLDLLLVRKIGVPGHSELAAGAVVDGAEHDAVFNHDILRQLGLTEADFAEAISTKLSEIETRRKAYLGDHPPEPLAGRTAIVVDDGIATGATVKAALKGLRRRAPAEIWLAVPVAPREALAGIMGLVDRLICLEQPAQFYAVGAHYRRFDQVSDEEVSRTLAAFRNEPKPREA